MLCSNISSVEPVQNRFGNNDTYHNCSSVGSSDNITLSQNTEDTYTILSEVTETALVPLSQITEMTEIDSIDSHIPLEHNQTGSNTITRWPQSSSAWNHVKGLRNHSNKDGNYNILKLATHF